MQMQSEVTQLILQKNPQLSTFRSRAIEGNKQYLRCLCNCVRGLLKSQETHPAAYEEITQLLVSAKPQVLTYLDSHVLEQVQRQHQRDDLNDYIRLWKNITGGDVRYPNLDTRLKNIILPQSHSQIPTSFQAFHHRFANNARQHFENRVQFFDPSSSLNSTISFALSESPAGSELLANLMKQMQEVRIQTENSRLSYEVAKNYNERVLKFLSYKPTTLTHEMSLDYNCLRIWAKQFAQKFQNLSRDGSLTVWRFPRRSKADHHLLDKNEPNSLHSNSSDVSIVADADNKKQEPPSFKDDSGFETKRIEMKQQIQKTIQQPAGQHRKLHVNSKQQAPQQPAGMKQQQNINITAFPQNQDKRQSNLVSSGEAFQSQTIPYDETNFHIKYDYPSNINYRQHHSISPLPKPLVSSQSSQNLINSSKSKSKGRPKIFGTKTAKLNSDGEVGNKQDMQKDEDLQIYDKQQDYADLMYNPRCTFLSDGTPYSSSSLHPKRFGLPLGPTVEISKIPHSIKKNADLNYLASLNSWVSQKGSVPQHLKLSQFNCLKLQRKEKLSKEQFGKFHNFIVYPYTKNFVDQDQFSSFKKQCLSDSSVAWFSQELVIQYKIERVTDTKIKLCLVYLNKGKRNLLMHTLYRIPTCMKYENTKVHRNWILESSYKHCFSLQVVSFPLEPCFLNFKYKELAQFDGQEPHDFVVITLPVTIRNYLQFLVISPSEWEKKWERWLKETNTRLCRNIRVDPQALSQVVKFGNAIELHSTTKFSLEEIGSFCCQNNLNNLYFLLKISRRTENAASLELLTNRIIDDQDELEYLMYQFDIWSFLLAKFDEEDGL